MKVKVIEVDVLAVADGILETIFAAGRAIAAWGGFAFAVFVVCWLADAPSTTEWAKRCTDANGIVASSAFRVCVKRDAIIDLGK